MNKDKSDPVPFEDKERVLCFHGPLLYEAKILKIGLKGEDGLEYFVHYKGWKEKWDEWVPSDRLVKFDPLGLERQRQLKQLHAQSKKSSLDLKSPQLGLVHLDMEDSHDALTSPTSPVVKKRRHYQSRKESLHSKRKKGKPVNIKINLKQDKIKSKSLSALKKASSELGASLTKMAMPNEMPPSLIVKLVEDWYIVTKLQMLSVLPTTNTISSVLEKYQEYRNLALTKDPTEDLEIECKNVAEFVVGLRGYLEFAIGKLLLYRMERHQLLAITKQFPSKSLCDIYGPIHLLRLYVKLPNVFNTLEMQTCPEFALVAVEFGHLLRYLEDQENFLFDQYTGSELSGTHSGYIKATAEYRSLTKHS